MKEKDATLFRECLCQQSLCWPLPSNWEARTDGALVHQQKCCALHRPFSPRGERQPLLLPFTSTYPSFLVFTVFYRFTEKLQAGKLSLNDANKNSPFTVNAWLHVFSLISKRFQYVSSLNTFIIICSLSKELLQQSRASKYSLLAAKSQHNSTRKRLMLIRKRKLEATSSWSQSVTSTRQ